MMIAYRPQILNPDKHPLMPDNYYWEKYEIDDSLQESMSLNGYTVLSVDNFNTAMSSIDLTAYNEATTINENQQLKIYDYMFNGVGNKYEPPIDFDFLVGLTIKLHRKSILVKGECIREEYYSDYNGTTYSNMVVKEETSYTRDAIGFPIYKTVTVSWIKKDEASHSTKKTWVKYYSNLEKISEGKTRRGNLVDNLQMPCIGLISIALTGNPNPTLPVIMQGRAFLANYKIEFDNFVDASNKEIIACFNDVNHPKYATVTNYPWIDSMTPYGVTIRAFLINELTI